MGAGHHLRGAEGDVQWAGATPGALLRMGTVQTGQGRALVAGSDTGVCGGVGQCDHPFKDLMSTYCVPGKGAARGRESPCQACAQCWLNPSTTQACKSETDLTPHPWRWHFSGRQTIRTSQICRVSVVAVLVGRKSEERGVGVTDAGT